MQTTVAAEPQLTEHIRAEDDPAAEGDEGNGEAVVLGDRLCAQHQRRTAEAAYSSSGNSPAGLLGATAALTCSPMLHTHVNAATSENVLSATLSRVEDAVQ